MNQQFTGENAFYLPAGTAKLLTEERIRDCKNLGLILDKYLPCSVFKDEKSKKDGRSIWLKKIQEEIHTGTHSDPLLHENIYQRWRSMTNALHAEHFTASVDWRMVVGLGGETVLETDLTLHHLYGIPYIPASALKGLVRAFVTKEKEGFISKQIEDDNEYLNTAFGSQKRAGAVIFFDAFPLPETIMYELDIMNPHYSKYYGEGRFPTNDQDPIPVTFLTVARTTFAFALAPRSSEDQQYVQQVKEWLQEALKHYGIGGKTSAGYGYFTDFKQAFEDREQPAKEEQPPQNPELQKAEAYAVEVAQMPDKDVASRINAYFQQWQKLRSSEARRVLAEAIIKKVREAGREKVSAEKAWYKELDAFLK
jgi:CRISPR-associated protein Cmr6